MLNSVLTWARSAEKRFKMRPEGVAAKKDRGLANKLAAAPWCSADEAFKVVKKNSQALENDTTTVVTQSAMKVYNK